MTAFSRKWIRSGRRRPDPCFFDRQEGAAGSYGLRKLTALNDQKLADLPKSVQLAFLLRPLRVTTLNDRSDMDVRYELFERLNTGGVLLHPQEIRNCIFRGKLRDQLKTLSDNPDFRKVVRIRQSE
jgi:hypothetical protein